MNLNELLELMNKPSERLIQSLKGFNQDIMVIGAGGKIGPSLCLKAANAFHAAGVSAKIFAVSLVFTPQERELLESVGVIIYEGDVSSETFLSTLPNVKNIIYLVGRKFGTIGNTGLTWMVNSITPAFVCNHFKQSNFVVFSTGNVYGLAPVLSGGFSEIDQLNPIGEYAQSCLARERVFEYYSTQNKNKVLMFRLNYAIDMRYGVLHDIAKAVYTSKPVDISQGVFNCIWQGDVNEYALSCLLHVDSPPSILNVTGPETISIKWVAEEFAKIFNKPASFVGENNGTALFSKTAKLNGLLGYPLTSLEQMIKMTANWISQDGETIEAPTHFETVDGRY